MKISQILQDYMTEHVEKNVIDTERARLAIRKLNKAFGTKDVSRLTPQALQRYRSLEGLAPATLNRELGVLSAALQHAKGKHRVKQVPEITLRKGAGKRTLWLRPEQIDDLLSSASHYPVIHNFICLCLLTGQRHSAVTMLKWSQIDWKQRVVWFADHGLAHADRRKGRGAVPISQELERILHSLKNPTEYVLLNQLGGRIRKISGQTWRTVVSAAGLTGLKPHDLRHTVATNLIRERVPLIEVSKLLGHASTEVTERVYVNFAPEFLQHAVNRLQQFVQPLAD